MRPVPAGGAGLGRGVASAGTSTQHQSRTLYWTSSSVSVMQEVKASQLCDQLHRSSRTEVGCGLRRHIYPTPVTLLILQLDQFILAVVRQCNKHHWSGVKNVTIMQLPKQSSVLTMKISDVVPEPRPDLGRGRARGRRRGSLPQLS